MPIISYKELSQKLISRQTYITNDYKMNDKSFIFFPLHSFECVNNPGSIYTLIIIGILPNGQKVAVMIYKIPVIIYVEDTPDAMKIIASINSSNISYEKEERKSIYGYNLPTISLLKITCNNHYTRNDLIRLLRSNCKTYMDDYSYINLIPIIGGKGKSLAQWSYINNYTIEPECKQLDSKIPVYSIDFKDYINIDPNNIPKECINMNLLVATWDTEVYTSTEAIHFPRKDVIKDEIFCLSIHFGWQHQKQPFISFTLILYECNELPQTNIVLCKNQRELLLTFTTILEHMMPDFIMGYNDWSFDWPYTIMRMRQLNILQECAEKMSLRPVRQKDLEYMIKEFYSKIDAESNLTGQTIRVDNCISCDIFPELKRRNKNMASNKLDAFLELHELPLKEEMKADKMNIIVRAVLSGKDMKDEMTKIASYCDTDAKSVFSLEKKINFIGDNIAIANLSKTTIYSAFYKAGAFRIGNAMGYEYYNQGYIYSNVIDYNNETFPGALVLRPPSGLFTAKQSLSELGIDEKVLPLFYNQIENTASYAATVIEENTKTITFTNNDKTYTINKPELVNDIVWSKFCTFLKLPTKYAVGDVDFASLYPSLMITFNLSPDRVITAESKLNDEEKEHINQCEVVFGEDDKKIVKVAAHRGDPKNFGVITKVLVDQFNNRMATKAKMKKIKAELEKDPSLSGMLVYLNSLQLAQKLVMNTTYGVIGSSISYLADKGLAAYVTTMGQHFLKLITDYASKNEFNVIYGDTDSSYLMPLYTTFIEVDRLYYSGKITKIEYFKQIHSITRNKIIAFEKQCNKMLIEYTKYTQLAVEFGHTHFPFLFPAKKQTISIIDGEILSSKGLTLEQCEALCKPRENERKIIFLKGVSLKKRNASKFLQKIMSLLIVQLMSIENIMGDNILEFINNFMRTYLCGSSGITVPYKMSDFIRISQYKKIEGKRGNPTINRFVERMKEEKKRVPFIGEMIEWIYADKPSPIYAPDTGKIIHLQRGDYLEWANDDIKPSIKIYIESEIAGSIASIISSNNKFADPEKPDDIKKRNANAKHYVISMCIPKVKCETGARLYKKIHSTTPLLITKTIESIIDNEFNPLIEKKQQTEIDQILAMNKKEVLKYRTDHKLNVSALKNEVKYFIHHELLSEYSPDKIQPLIIKLNRCIEDSCIPGGIAVTKDKLNTIALSLDDKIKENIKLFRDDIIRHASPKFIEYSKIYGKYLIAQAINKKYPEELTYAAERQITEKIRTDIYKTNTIKQDVVNILDKIETL